jgi:phi13 family phage major tail protein
MAKIGLKRLNYNNGTNAGNVGKAITADINIETQDAELYAEDALDESDSSFKKGSISLNVSDLSDTVQNHLLSHVSAGGEMTANSNDQAPYVKLAFYAIKMVAGIKKFRAIYLPKVLFKEPNDNNSTKGDSTSFGTHTIEGKIIQDSNGDWKKERTFDNEADAIAYVDGKVGLPLTASGGLTGLTMTGTGGTLTPVFGSAVRSYAFTGLTGVSCTITPTAALHTIKLYIDGVYSQDIVSGSASAAIPMSIGTKKLTLVAQEAGKQSQTTEIVVVKTA